ncbi:MAG: hypothetical protein Q4P72_03850 [Eubacteriales bacterium]|nr:hypothetical protein [Eubacteriales bacterium]
MRRDLEWAGHRFAIYSDKSDEDLESLIEEAELYLADQGRNERQSATVLYAALLNSLDDKSLLTDELKHLEHLRREHESAMNLAMACNEDLNDRIAHLEAELLKNQKSLLNLKRRLERFEQQARKSASKKKRKRSREALPLEIYHEEVQRREAEVVSARLHESLVGREQNLLDYLKWRTEGPLEELDEKR